MYKQLDKYCTFYLICQGTRVIYRKQVKKLQFFFILTKKLEVLIMNFIFCLQESVTNLDKHYEILLLLDELSKMCHYTIFYSDITKKPTKVITQEVI